MINEPLDMGNEPLGMEHCFDPSNINFFGKNPGMVRIESDLRYFADERVIEG